MTGTLAIRPNKVYSSLVTDKEVTEFDSSNNESAQAAQCGIFVCVYPRVPSMGGDGRGAARLAGVLSCRSVNPAICRPPHLTVRRRINRTKESIMPSKTISKKSPVRVATKSTAASLLGTLSKDEISFLLNVRSLDIEYQEHFQRMAQNLFDKSLVKSRPSLSIVRTTSISSIGGGRHA